MCGIRKEYARILVFFFLLPFFGNQEARAQVGLSVRSYPSSGYNFVYQPGMNGVGITLDYTLKKLEAVDLFAGLEYRISDWGHLVLLSSGAQHTWWEGNRWSFSSRAGLLNGLALFRPKSLYIIGAETTAHLYLRIFNRFGLFATAGLRWSTCPAYRNYGLIWSYLEIPVGTGILFSF